MSGHAQGVLAQLREADEEPNIDVDDQALRDATIEGLREHADDLDTFRQDAHHVVDAPLADTANHLRAIADALEDGAQSEHSVRLDANYCDFSEGGQQ